MRNNLTWTITETGIVLIPQLNLGRHSPGAENDNANYSLLYCAHWLCVVGHRITERKLLTSRFECGTS